VSFSRDQWEKLLTTGGGLLSLLETGSNPEALIGEQFGSFTITSLIDRGGMACVYRAERTDEAFRQQVAIKIMHVGLDQPELVSRFLTERQILADLDHPGIARIFDSGVSEDQRPYLIMEYIDGEPIDDWCDREQPDLHTLLGIMVSVCDAVHSAHEKGIIHQDLKAGNLLIDSHGQTKLLDFGIARVFDQSDQSSTDQALYTPLIAAPEQYRQERASECTDVWQIGVLLYRLISGRYPFEADRDAAALKACILDQPPAEFTATLSMPSLMRMGLKDVLSACLAKQPGDRYRNVRALGDDLRRLRDGEALGSASSHGWNGLRRMILRRRAPLTAACLIIALGGGGLWLYQSHLAEQQQQNDAMTDLLVEAIEATDPSRENDALSDIISSADFESVTQSRANTGAARRVLLSTASRLIDRGEFSRAITLLTDHLGSVSDLTRLPADKAEHLSLLGYAHYRAGDLDSAGPMMERAFSLLEQQPKDAWQARAGIVQRLGLFERHRAQTDRAYTLIEQSWQMTENQLADQPLLLARANNHLGLVLSDLDRFDEAERAYRRSIAAYEQLADQQLASALTAANLADVLRQSGRLPEAIELARKSVLDVDASSQSLPTHRALVRVTLGNAQMRQQQYADAIEAYQVAHEIYQQSLGASHPRVASSAHNLATAYRLNGQCDRARPLYEEALSGMRESLGENHPRVQASARQLALCPDAER